MRNPKNLVQRLLLLVAASFAAQAVAIEYHGYFRTGVGGSQWGTDQQKFEVNGADAKFRLGNETDTYIETGFSQDHGTSSETQPFFRSNLKFSFKSAGHRDWEPTNPDFNATGAKTADQATVVALREAYAEGKNICGAGTNLWIGKRFYMREDLHLLDFYLIDNAGPGLGLEGVDVGGLKLHTAVTRNVPAPEANDLPIQTNLDLRLTGLELAKGASLTPVLIYGATTERGQGNIKRWESLSGIHSALFYRQALGEELNNQLALQYGTGIFGANGAWGSSTLNQWGGWGSNGIADNDDVSKKARDKSSTLRVSDQLTLGKSSNLSGQFVVVYESADFGGALMSINGTATKIPAKTKLFAGVRPQYHFSQNALLAVEVGHVAVGKQKIGDATLATEKFADLSMAKFTVAPTLTPDLGFWTRPQLRFFATYAQWNEKEALAGQFPTAQSVYTDDSGWSVGSQVEAWW